MTTTIGTTQTSLAFNNVTADLEEWYVTRFVSTPLDMTSISANTWTYNFAGQESDGLLNFPVFSTDKAVRINCYVWRPSGSTKVGTILDGDTAATVDEGAVSTEVAHHVTFSGSAVSSMQTNDVLIFEVWFLVNPGSGTGHTATFYYDGTTENTTDNATVSNHASFLETPQNLTFAGTEISMTQNAAKTYSNKFITKT